MQRRGRVGEAEKITPAPASPVSPHASTPAVGDPPDRAVAVLADEERAVVGDRYADRAAPDAAVVDHEAGQEILVFAGRPAVLQQYPHDLVAGAPGAVPRPVERRKNVAAVFGGEL